MDLVKPCKKCGAMDRYKSGDCRPCDHRRKKLFREENQDKISEQNRRYREENREQIAERKRQYQQEHREQIAERKRQYYLENREQIAEWQRQYYLENRETHYAQCRRYAKRNPEAVAESKKRYAQNNPAKVVEARRRYYKNNVAAYNEASSRRRALKRLAIPPGCEKDPRVKAVYKIANWIRRQGEDVHVDHITPLILGGLHNFDNLRILSAKENRSKGPRPPTPAELRICKILRASAHAL